MYNDVLERQTIQQKEVWTRVTIVDCPRLVALLVACIADVLKSNSKM